MIRVSVFRVENERGEGPYKGSTHDALMPMYDEHGFGDHPNPQEDPLLEGLYPNEVCGFATLDAVYEWFDGYEDLLEECGFLISCYTMTTDTVRYGLQQCVFRRGSAVPVRSFSIN